MKEPLRSTDEPLRHQWASTHLPSTPPTIIKLTRPTQLIHIFQVSQQFDVIIIRRLKTPRRELTLQSEARVIADRLQLFKHHSQQILVKCETISERKSCCWIIGHRECQRDFKQWMPKHKHAKYVFKFQVTINTLQCLNLILQVVQTFLFQF